MKRIVLRKRLPSRSSRIQFVAIALVTALTVAGAGMLVGMPPIAFLPTATSPTQEAPSSLTASPIIPTASATPKISPTALPIEKPVATPTPQSAIQQAPVAQAPAVKAVPLVKPYLGHLPYQEAEPDRLVDAGRFIRGTYERSESLDFEANAAFQAMVNAAKAEGVSLMPISGFRNIADQRVLFEKQVERKGSEEAAAKWSAPPGYSEHHTGYAIDIGDMNSDNDLKMTFQDTDAYRWLKANAQTFGFEQSFPYNNPQGVSYEPWHWRYAASPRAGQIFAVAHSHE
jgi:zinc D-Ala-D-Ala carboxypeptidase